VLNKPAGVVTTMSDPQGRTTVAALVPVREYPGLFPVGRLDYETTGLLLFTTDGEIAHRLLHPSRHVEKIYRVLVDGRATESELDRLREGVSLDDGLTAPARVRAMRSSGGTTYCEIAISEGRKRQVRRMFSAVGHPVLELHRVQFGPVELGDLSRASWRLLDDREVAALREAVGMTAGGN
jgi:23S rRNA pseudouridine2605 synthase